jgi:hypothetical protein
MRSRFDGLGRADLLPATADVLSPRLPLAAPSRARAQLPDEQQTAQLPRDPPNAPALAADRLCGRCSRRSGALRSRPGAHAPRARQFEALVLGRAASDRGAPRRAARGHAARRAAPARTARFAERAVPTPPRDGCHTRAAGLARLVATQPELAGFPPTAPVTGAPAELPAGRLERGEQLVQTSGSSTRRSSKGTRLPACAAARRPRWPRARLAGSCRSRRSGHLSRCRDYAARSARARAPPAAAPKDTGIVRGDRHGQDRWCDQLLPDPT